MRRDARAGESGFSLVELLVAMVVTLIVSGAIYGLLASGQSAFRREPEVTDRQQNIRIAMDLIMRDVGSAGVGMPGFMQVFSQNLNSCAACPPSPSGGVGGANTDDLEVLANPGGFDPEPSCHYPGGAAATLFLRRNRTGVQPGQVFLVFLDNGYWTIREATASGTASAGAGECAPGNDKMRINSSPGGAGVNLPGGICASGPNAVGTAQLCDGGACPCSVRSIGQGEVVTYRIRPGPDGVPNLERRGTGSLTGAFTTGFQIVARGIEDMQVQYMNGGGGWVDDPGRTACDPANSTANCIDPTCFTPDCTQCTPANGCDGGGAAPDPISPTPAGYNTLVRQVRVTLWSRTTAPQGVLVGETTAAAGPRAIRGQLSSTITIRASHFALSVGLDPAAAPPRAYWQ